MPGCGYCEDCLRRADKKRRLRIINDLTLAYPSTIGQKAEEIVDFVRTRYKQRLAQKEEA